LQRVLVNEKTVGVFTLDSISKEFIGMGKNEKSFKLMLLKLGVLILKLRCGVLPAPLVGEYAETRCRSYLKNYGMHYNMKITQQDLWDVFNLETNLFPLFNRYEVQRRSCRRRKS
jgi:hypothetical protein